MQSNSILIADPDESMVEQLRELLERRGYLVLAARDGDTALAIASTSSVELIVTELYLATGGERCLVRALRNTRELKRLRILAHTIHAGREHRLWAVRSGADEYRLKSTDPERLLGIIARLLSEHTVGQHMAPVRPS